MRFIFSLLLACVAMPGWTAEDAGARFSPVIKQVESTIKSKMRKYRLAGLSVVLVADDRIVWNAGYGWSDVEKRVPAAADSRYQLGAITQLYTTMAILQLVEADKLSLDTPISALLPDLQLGGQHMNEREQITVRSLLTHHGGVQGSRLQGLFLDQPPTGLRSQNAIVVPQKPQSIYSYSNEGYELLGRVIESVSGIAFSEYVTQRVLRPMGMKGEYWNGEQLAAAHNRRKKDPIPFPQYQAAMGMQGSTQDLARLIRLVIAEGELDGTRIVSAANMREMVRRQNTDVRLDLDNSVGLGWQLTDISEHRADIVLRSQSASLRYGAVLLIAPAEGIGLAILSNSNDASEPLLDISQEIMDQALYVATGRSPPQRSDQPGTGKPLPEAATVASMSGVYSTLLGMIGFSGDADHYRMSFLGRTFHATMREDGWYDVRYRLLGFINLSFGLLKEILLRPVTIDEQAVLLVQFRGQVLLFGATFDKMPVSDRWQNLTGAYELINPDVLSEQLNIDEIRFDYEDNLLTFSYRLPFFLDLRVRMPVLPVGEDELIIPGLGTNMGEPVQLLASPDGPVFEYSGYRFGRKR